MQKLHQFMSFQTFEDIKVKTNENHADEIS